MENFEILETVEKLKKVCLKRFFLQKIDKNKSFVQKQPLEVFIKESVLKNIHKIHKKISMLESPLPLCWFSLHNSEMVTAVTLAFCSIQ